MDKAKQAYSARHKFLLFDYLICFAALSLIAAAFFWAQNTGEGEPQFHIEGPGGVWLYPRDAEETIDVEGPLGITRILISNGTARVLSSPCQSQVCTGMGAIHKPGGWIACLPNRVVISVERTGNTKEVIDGVSY